MKLLFRLAHQHLEFRFPELCSLLDLYGLQKVLEFDIDRSDERLQNTPFLLATLHDDSLLEQVIRMASRSIATITLYQVIEAADSREGLVQKTKNLDYASIFSQDKGLSFKYTIDSFGKKYTGKESQSLIRGFSFLPLESHIDLENPQVVYTLVIRTNSGILPIVPEEWYYTRLLTTGGRSAIDLFDLKKRNYIGITSMDAELSLYMSNMGKLRRGCLVLDPFMGTGSFLVTAAHFGAFTLGSDIDGRQMRGNTTGNVRQYLNETRERLPFQKSKDPDGQQDVYSNAEQYNLQNRVLDMLVFDNNSHPWTRPQVFDAILCDRKSTLVSPFFINFSVQLRMGFEPVRRRSCTRRFL